jgi:hypothetical protein
VVVDDPPGDAPGVPSVAYHVTFNAVCSVDGDGEEEDVIVRLLINDVVVAPGEIIMCEDVSAGDKRPTVATAAQWASKGHSPGANTIKVQWRISHGGTIGFFNKFNLTVQRHDNN